jgi:hypothetical protein
MFRGPLKNTQNTLVFTVIEYHNGTVHRGFRLGEFIPGKKTPGGAGTHPVVQEEAYVIETTTCQADA